MFLWWVGNLVLIGVVLPVVLILLNRVLRPTMEIKAYADDVLEHGVGITKALDAVPELVRTTQLTAVARQNAARYGAALQKLV